MDEIQKMTSVFGRELFVSRGETEQHNCDPRQQAQLLVSPYELTIVQVYTRDRLIYTDSKKLNLIG